MRVSAIIPAYNEAPTIGKVVATLKQVPLVDEIIVVSDGSRDGTAEVARRQGALVVDLEINRGKGRAMLEGAFRAQGEILLFLDADLEGLTPRHVEELLRPVLDGEADMTVGIFCRGRHLTDWAQVLAPYLSGQRAIPKSLFLAAGKEASGFEIEVMLSRFARDKGLRVKRVPLPNMTHVMKEEKRGLARGIAARLGMYKDIAGFFLRYRRRNKKTLRPVVWLLFLLLVGGLLAYDISHTRTARAANQSLGELPLTGEGERILVISPHPDDEVLAAGGLLLRARAMGEEVRVVFLTNGDGFRRGAEVWNGGLPPGPNDFLAYGQKRREEARKALAVLGVPQEELTFLGYPDGGLAKIWWNYWEENSPYRSATTLKDAVPYKEALSPGRVYVGINILTDLLKVLRDYRPTAVFLPDTADSHPDHWATGAFSLAALAIWERESGAALPKVYSYLVHSGAWQLAPALRRSSLLFPPGPFLYRGTPWYRVSLDEPAQIKKKQALEEYGTQKAVIGTFMSNFVRPNELFSRVEIKRLKEEGTFLVALDPPREVLTQRLEKGGDLQALYVEIKPQSLRLKLALWDSVGPRVSFRLGVYVVRGGGLVPPERFAFWVPAGKTGQLKWDARPLYYAGKARVSYEDKALDIELDDFPELYGTYLLLEAESFVANLPVDCIPWQMVKI